jgi:hypothetical protein
MIMATTPTSPVPTRHIGTPNPQALNAVLDRYFLWLAKQNMEKRAKKLRGRNRSTSIKI